MHDPMCAFIEDEEKIKAMMDLMLYYQQEWLPTFKEVIPKKEDLENGRYWVDKKELATYEDAITVKYPPSEDLRSKCLP
jgi:hypothetical protein